MQAMIRTDVHNYNAYQQDYNRYFSKKDNIYTNSVTACFGEKIIVKEERQLSPEEEMLQFQKEFWDEVARIPKTSTIDNLAIHVTDEAWERMKEEPEYRKAMMDLIKRDTTGNFIMQVNSVITIGATKSEYRAQSWSSVRETRDESIERRRKKRKEYQEFVEAMRARHKFLYEQYMQQGNVWDNQLMQNEQGSQESSASNVSGSSMMLSVCASYEANITFAAFS